MTIYELNTFAALVLKTAKLEAELTSRSTAPNTDIRAIAAAVARLEKRLNALLERLGEQL